MSGKAILFVDDEELIIKSLLMQIRGHFGDKYMYEAAQSGDEALDVLEELLGFGIETIIVVSDWLMPGMKGDEFLVEAHRRYPDMVKIMLTGQADQSAVANAEENGNLFQCIRKPWEKEHLIEVLEGALSSVEL